MHISVLLRVVILSHCLAVCDNDFDKLSRFILVYNITYVAFKEKWYAVMSGCYFVMKLLYC